MLSCTVTARCSATDNQSRASYSRQTFDSPGNSQVSEIESRKDCLKTPFRKHLIELGMYNTYSIHILHIICVMLLHSSSQWQWHRNYANKNVLFGSWFMLVHDDTVSLGGVLKPSLADRGLVVRVRKREQELACNSLTGIAGVVDWLKLHLISLQQSNISLCFTSYLNRKSSRNTLM